MQKSAMIILDSVFIIAGFGGILMKLVFASLAALVVFMCLMFAVVSVVSRENIGEGVLVGGVGIGILLVHLYSIDTPKLLWEDEEDG
ncbi:hypothetical protein HMPREF9088_1238 [Enterococcus italicus DSM 15952]|uniref:Uncharacterized protein n=2 Tax=Enterococcus italicus TaxID=246144 RepID=E6LFU8_ENTI1|nr:hypothetical protein HMPREF9088_1238 [Enterococcus italicus DSM 15952]